MKVLWFCHCRWFSRIRRSSLGLMNLYCFLAGLPCLCTSTPLSPRLAQSSTLGVPRLVWSTPVPWTHPVTIPVTHRTMLRIVQDIPVEELPRVTLVFMNRSLLFGFTHRGRCATTPGWSSQTHLLLHSRASQALRFSHSYFSGFPPLRLGLAFHVSLHVYFVLRH